MGTRLAAFLLASFLYSFTSVAQPVPMLLNSGDSAVFTFDFSPVDISSAQSIGYFWNTTLVDGSPVSGFDMSFGLLDELGESPVYSYGPGSFVPTYTVNWSPGRLTDDPISFIAVDFLSANYMAPSSALMSITANAYENGEIVASITGVPSSVPAPATLGLLVLGAAGLGWTRYKKAY